MRFSFPWLKLDSENDILRREHKAGAILSLRTSPGSEALSHTRPAKGIRPRQSQLSHTWASCCNRSVALQISFQLPHSSICDIQLYIETSLSQLVNTPVWYHKTLPAVGAYSYLDLDGWNSVFEHIASSILKIILRSPRVDDYERQYFEHSKFTLLLRGGLEQTKVVRQVREFG